MIKSGRPSRSVSLPLRRGLMLTLYHHPFCPHSRFVRLALGEMGDRTASGRGKGVGTGAGSSS